jgi:hypothetical protein
VRTIAVENSGGKKWLNRFALRNSDYKPMGDKYFP